MAAFGENDIRLLEKTLFIREQIVDAILKEKISTKPRDVDSFTNLLESIDRSVIGKAKVNIEDTNSKNNEETKEILKGLLLELHKGDETLSIAPVINNDIPVFKPTGMEILPGETILKMDVVDTSNLL